MSAAARRATSTGLRVRPPFVAPLPLGVGCAVAPGQVEVVARVRPLLDLVELRPQRRSPVGERLPSAGSRAGDHVDVLRRQVGASGLPVAVHAPGLSHAGAWWSRHALADVDGIRRRVPMVWTSDGVQGLVPDEPSGDLAALRAAVVQRRSGRPFLVSTAADDRGRVPGALVADVARRANCGIVIDLRGDPGSWPVGPRHDHPANGAARLPMERVVAVHLPATAATSAGRDRVEDRWDAVVELVGSAPSLAAVVVVPAPGVDVVEPVDEAVDRLRADLERLRAIWHRHRPEAGEPRRDEPVGSGLEPAVRW